MKLNTPVKILVGLGTLWLFLYPILFIVAWATFVPGLMGSASADSPFSLFSTFNLFYPLSCLTSLIQLALMGFYLFHILKNTALSDTVRAIFGIGIFLMYFIAMPVYYYFFILRSEIPAWALPRETQPGPGPLPAEYDRSSKKKVTLVVSILGVVTLLILAATFVSYQLVNNFSQTVQEKYFAEPTPMHYDVLPTYAAGQNPLYQPVDPTGFTPIITFKGITTWNDHNHTPILFNGDTMFIAGYVNHSSDNWRGSVNVDIFNANIQTGKANWQTTAGSTLLQKDGQRIYLEAPNDLSIFAPAGLIAYDASTGSKVWETRFKEDDAAGVNDLVISETEIQVETNNHGVSALYTLDKATGAIKDFKKQTSLHVDDQVVIYDGMQFEKQGYGLPDQISATRVSDGSVIWKYSDERVMSNIAVGGAVTYVLTEKNHLIALDTKTGEVLGKLAFAPRFAHDFDFVNTSLVVAAAEDMVAVYYEDSQQLSVFRFTSPAK